MSLQRVLLVLMVTLLLANQNIFKEQAVYLTTSWSAEKQTSPQRRSFLQDPQRFVQAFFSCLEDASCRIYYNHVGKTGGNTVEEKFSELLGLPKICSKCNGRIFNRFQAHPEWYCQRKFSAYQVTGDKFEQILRTCREEYNPSPSSRAVVLQTFREPLAMVVSSIHQRCNKNLDRRNHSTLEACRNCNYELNPEFWNNFIEEKTEKLRSVLAISKLQMERVQVFGLDLTDIDSFLQMLTQSNATVEHENPEKTLHCNFRVPSSMIKRHAEAAAIYRNLTLGL